MSQAQFADPEAAMPSYWPLVTAALLMSLALTGLLVSWGMLARLDAALVTQGVLHADSERKTVDHLEGGILSEILVRSGDKVEAGQVVARLAPTQIQAKLTQLKSERDTVRFTIWRLAAAEVGRTLDAMTAPAVEAGDRDAHITEARRLFDARRRSHAAKVASLNREIAQLQGQITANEGQRSAAATQLRLWQDERGMVADLVARGASPRRNLMELDRAMAAMAGQRDESNGLIEAARQGIARARADIEALEQQRLAEIASSRAEARGRLATLNSQIRAMDDIMDRLELRAPQAGKVVEINLATPGAVLASGQSLMEILPRNDRLVALIKLPPDAIDTVQVGVPAKLRLTAYKRADAPQATGQVIYVSADLLTDEQTGTRYFEGRVGLDADSVAALDEVTLSAGMPVEVTLTIGERRAGDYMLEPLLRHFRRAFREE